MPSAVVRMKPWGSFSPGVTNLAITPAMKPMIIVQRMLSMFPSPVMIVVNYSYRHFAGYPSLSPALLSCPHGLRRPRFIQGDSLPARSYDSMPSKEVLMAENSIRPARWGDPPVGPAMRGGPQGVVPLG